MSVQAIAAKLPTSTSKGQLSGKYYRTRSLSQNLQQIFHPNRQSHSRSINNLSMVGSLKFSQMRQSPQVLPQSLPQSPRVLVEQDCQTVEPFYSMAGDSFNVKPLSCFNFTPPSQLIFPKISFSQTVAKQPMPIINATSGKVKGNKILEKRNSHYFMRSQSVDAARAQLQKLPGIAFRKTSHDNSKETYHVNEAVEENVQLLKKFSEPVRMESTSLWQSTFKPSLKAKLAALFKNKKKYSLAEPNSNFKSRYEGNVESFHLNRDFTSCQSLPALVDRKTNKSMHKNVMEVREKKKTRKKLKKKVSLEKPSAKLRALNLNPPMIGGSCDNLFMNRKKLNNNMYETYHGRPMTQYQRLKVSMFKKRMLSESDEYGTRSEDGTTTLNNFENENILVSDDSGEMSDTSSLIQSSTSDNELSSSFSDITTKSSKSHRRFKLRTSTSLRSMPQTFNTNLKHFATTQQTSVRDSPLVKSSLSFSKKLQEQPSSGFFYKPPIVPKNQHHNVFLQHQISAPSLFTNINRQFVKHASSNDYSIMMPSLLIPKSNIPSIQSPSMMTNPPIFKKGFSFPSGPENDCAFPLVSQLS